MQVNEKAAPRGNGEAAKCGTMMDWIVSTKPAVAQASPLASDIKNMAVALGTLAARLEKDDWDYLRMLRQNLLDCADRAAALENFLEIPHA